MLANQMYMYTTGKSCPIVGELASSLMEGRGQRGGDMLQQYHSQNMFCKGISPTRIKVALKNLKDSHPEIENITNTLPR